MQLASNRFKGLKIMNKVYTKQYRVLIFETDFGGKAHLLTLLNYLQDAAAEQAAKKDLGMEGLIQKKLAWLLSRYHVKVSHYPGASERLEVSTWPSGKKGIFALRDFEIKDQEGRCVLTATSSWILFDLAKKQPARLDDFLPDNLILAKRALSDDFPSFPQLKKVEREVGFRVLMKDLDFNRHVNNIVYIHWALEAVPPDILNSKRPIDIEVSYKAEAFYGEEIVSKVERKDAETAVGFLHQIVNKNTGIELARLQTVWGTFP